jgi:hypothetical protein
MCINSKAVQAHTGISICRIKRSRAGEDDKAEEVSRTLKCSASLENTSTGSAKRYQVNYYFAIKKSLERLPFRVTNSL